MEEDWGRGSAPRWDSQARQPVRPLQWVGVSLRGGASRGREAWLGCQVPSPFVQLLSCCLGQSPEQPPPERTELSSLPAPALIPALPLPSPARLHTQVRTIAASIAGARERRRAAERPILAVSGQVKEIAREHHPAPAAGGALGSWARRLKGREAPAECTWDLVSWGSEKGGERSGQVPPGSRLPRGPQSSPDAVSLTLAWFSRGRHFDLLRLRPRAHSS